jgi:hypothetical protein
MGGPLWSSTNKKRAIKTFAKQEKVFQDLHLTARGPTWSLLYKEALDDLHLATGGPSDIHLTRATTLFSPNTRRFFKIFTKQQEVLHDAHLTTGDPSWSSPNKRRSIWSSPKIRKSFVIPAVTPPPLHFLLTASDENVELKLIKKVFSKCIFQTGRCKLLNIQKRSFLNLYL